VYGTQVFDYEILKADSDRADWYLKEQPDEKAGETLYHSVVGVHRKGDFIFPVEVVVKFNNGEQIREHWDGRDRWVRYSYNKKSKLVSAELDPDHTAWLDKDFFNNSHTDKPDSGAHKKIATYWLMMTQFLAQCLAWMT